MKATIARVWWAAGSIWIGVNHSANPASGPNTAPTIMRGDSCSPNSSWGRAATPMLTSATFAIKSPPALAAKRQQNPAQGVSPEVGFRADTSREAAADASNLPPLRGCDIYMNTNTQRLRAGLSSRAASRLWATHPCALGYILSPLRGEINSFASLRIGILRASVLRHLRVNGGGYLQIVDLEIKPSGFIFSPGAAKG